MGNHIHSFNTMAIAKGNALGNMNLPIEEYRRIFLYIISEKDPINITINNLYKKYNGEAYLPYFSDSSISELISYAFPNKYVTYNRRDEKALEILGLKLDKIRGNACVSRRQIVSLNKKEDKAKVIEKYKVGDVIKNAVVKGYSNFGCFFDVNSELDVLVAGEGTDKPPPARAAVEVPLPHAIDLVVLMLSSTVQLVPS